MVVHTGRSRNREYQAQFGRSHLGVNELTDDDRAALLAKMRAFDGFNADNYPHREQVTRWRKCLPAAKIISPQSSAMLTYERMLVMA